MPIATLIIEYNTDTHNVSIKCNPPEMLDSNRDLLYVLCDRAKEEVMLRQAEIRAGRRSVAVPNEEDARPAGKGFRSADADRTHLRQHLELSPDGLKLLKEKSDD